MRQIETVITPSLSLTTSEALMDVAQSAASGCGLALCFVVCDAAGQLIAFRRMESAGRISIEVAPGKARTAALFGKPMRGFAEMIDGGAVSMRTVSNAVMIPGGVPVIHQGMFVGALGVSGATGDFDDEIATGTVVKFTRESK